MVNRFYETFKRIQLNIHQKIILFWNNSPLQNLHSSNPCGSNYELTNSIARNCPLTDQSWSGVSQPVRGIIAAENTLPHSPILIPDELTTSAMPQHNEILPRLNGKTKAFWLCPKLQILWESLTWEYML